LKVARALAFVAIGLGLQAIGLDLSLDTVSEGAQRGIILLFGVFVGLCFVAAGWQIYRADIPKPSQN
jgi:Na+/melibiose symporter-like transporter